MSDPINNQDVLDQQLEEKMSSLSVRGKEEDTKATAQKLNLPYLNLALSSVSASAITILDENLAHAGQMAVIDRDGKKLRVAVADPEIPQTKTNIEKLVAEGYSVTLFLVSQLSLAEAWKRYQIEKRTEKSELGVVSIKETDLSDLQKQIAGIADLKDKIAKISTTQMLNVLVAGALKVDASDIHFEPEEDKVRLRYRIDGVLQDILDFPSTDYSHVLSRIKLLSGLKLNLHDVPQDGRFTIRQEETDLEIRTSILPGAYGENIVMRILDPRRIRQRIEELGMREDTLGLVRTLLKKTTGAIITTGPTGAGKTTTLYAFINQVNDPDVKIITIEDPIEYHIEGISQTQVDPSAGYTFANGLRSIVRQDPDVILVGEIRDAETADIAMQASLTGHLVFSTLHTNDAAGAIPRLIDFNIKPITIAPAMNAAMAQRLVRRLCLDCRKLDTVKDMDLATFQKYLETLPAGGPVPKAKIEAGMQIYYPQKCNKCNMTGYKDRIGVYEIFVIDPEMEKLIITSPSITDIKNFAIKKGMITMLQDGLLKVVEGLTSVDEVLRVVGE